MSRPGSSSKFVSVNLNKSYGQPTPLAGGGGSSSSPMSSASGLNRSRLPNSHGGMVFLSRPSSRPPPASSTSSSAPPLKASRLAVPRPVNLPSLRKEHAGNDPAVALVGVSGSSGWTKQQVLAHPVDNSVGQPGSSIVDPALGQVRSVALTTESTWGAPITQRRQVASHEVANQSLEEPPPSSQAPIVARSLLYTPPGARSTRGNVSLVPAHLTLPSVEKIVLLRGEDFPTLQAALPSPAAPPQQRQRDLQQKQREKQNDLKEQQKKLQQLSQQPLGHKTAEDLELTHHISGPQLQPAQPVRPQAKSKQSSNYSQEEGRSLDYHGTFFERANRRSGEVGGTSYGPLQSTRWSHASNWVDDERETLQTLRAEGMSQSDRVEPGRPRNGYHFTDNRARDHGPNVGFGRPVSRNGSLSGLGRNAEDSRDHFPVRNGGLSFEGAHGKAGDFSNGYTNKGIYSDRLVMKPVDGDSGRNGFLKQVPVSAVTDSKDGRFGSSSRPSGLNRDIFMYRDNGYERERNGSVFRDAENVRDVSYRRDTFHRDTIRQDGYRRDVGLRQESGFGKDNFPSKRGVPGNNVDGSHGWQGDRVGRNSIYQFDGNAAYSHFDSNVGARDRQDMFGSYFGRDRRPKFSYGQLQGQYPLLGDHMEFRVTSVFDLEPCAGIPGLEVKALRRKKDDSKDDNFRDLARESFEAELERVQTMQEQERQRTIDEQKKVIELARKEQEEREKLARAEEEFRLKLEEEAREAAGRAQIEAEEAVRRAEEEHKAREEERERIVLEEERRKDAARRKLLELEERIAKREFEKRQEAIQKEDGPYLVRPQNDKIMRSQDDVRKVEELDWEDQDRFLPSFGKAEQDDDERAPFSADWRSNLPLAGREVVERPSSRSRLVDPASWSTDMKGRHGATERTKTVQTWLGEVRDNGDGLPLAPAKPHLRDDFLPHRQHEQHQRGLSNRELSHEATRTHFSGEKLGRVRSELSARSGQASIGQDQRWTSNENTCFSAGYSSVDADSGFVDSAIARDADRWWGRDDHRRSQGQCLMSPPLPPYPHSAGTSDYPSFGRLRQSLPKQPRVPPPPPGRATIPEQIFKSENAGFVPSVLGDGGSGITPRAREDCSERVELEVHESEDEYKEDELSIDVQVAKHQESATPEEVSVQPDMSAQVSVECAQGSTVCHVQIHLDDVHERVLSDPLSEKVDSGISIPTPSRERPEEYEDDVTIDSQSGMAEEPTDDDDGWIVQQGEDDLDEELTADDCVEVYKEGTHLEVEDQESGSPSKSIEDVEGDGEPTSKYLAEDCEELNTKAQTQEGRHEEDVTGKLDKPFDSELEDSPECIQEVGQGAEDLKGLDLQRTMQEPVAQPILLQPSYMSASPMKSVQFQQPEGLSSRQSFVQQFQQPFSFMAVPLPQSTSSNTVAPHPAMLTPVHGLQNHQEVPFHLQLGLLSGTPLIPNAIQIGSIQMPLHMHPQVPQLAHLHGLQPPMFQFGQLGHSAPLTQPLHIVQPDVQAHNAVGQPLLSEHHQLKADEPLSRVDTLDSLPRSDQVFNAGDELLAQKAGFMWIEHNAALDRPYHRERANSRSSVSSECSFEQKDQFPLISLQEKNYNMQALPSKERNSEGTHSIVISPETVADVRAVQNAQADQSSVLWPSEMILGGGRNNSSQSNGALGQGQSRFSGRKSDDLEPPHSTTEVSLSEMRAEGGINNRMFCRNFFGSQYKVRDSFSSFDNESAVTTNQGRHQPRQEYSHASSGLEVSSGLASGGGTNRDGLRESGTHMYNRALGKELGQTLNSRSLQGGSKGDRSYSQKVPLKNGLTNNLHSDGVPKKYKAQSAGIAPLQTDVVCVFEQHGIEVPNDEDDFIEVRSKRQMLREQREQREKDSKAKSKEIKEKEQPVRKQPRLSAKVGQHNEAAATIASKNGTERQTGLSAEVASNEIRLSMHSLSAGTAITSPPASVTPTSVQVLPPIGTLASASLDGTVENMSKGSKPGQASSTLGAGFACGNHSDSPDSVSNTTTAWGGQWSARKVVSLTQIQLEEAMKPIRFEGPRLQKIPMSDMMSVGLEPEIPVAPIVVHEIAPALARSPGSVSGPISSLLAGEKIQFGAVTSPSLISPSSHPLSPALLVGVDSSLGSGSDVSHNYTHSGHARHYSGSDRDVAFTSKGKHTRGDDGIHRQVVDPEAEAEAAASAVAVAAISSDESGGNAHCLDARNAVLSGPAVAVAESSFEIIDDFAGSPGVPVTRPVMMQTPIKAPGIEDSMAVALPADLSVENRLPLLQGSLSNCPASSGQIFQSFPSCAPPFPCLEMGTMLGSPIFTFGPHEDASPFQQVSRPGVSLEPSLAAVGASGVGGWQQRHAGTADSFYGATPSGFTGPFISPTGGIPNIQGPPHMLVYTNPFAPVGQFGQLGVSFMGTTYLPSGKQPDWKHTPLTTSCSGASGVGDGVSAGLSGTIMSHRSTTASNSVQQMSPIGSSVIPVAAPLSLFDANLSAPFQIPNADVSVQSQWSEVSAPHLHMPIPGQLLGLSLQPQHSSHLVPNQFGHFPHFMDVGNGFHHLPVPTPVVSSSSSTVDAAQLPDELGVGDCVSSNTFHVNGGPSSGRGYANNSAVPGTTGSAGIKSQRGRRLSRNSRGGSNGATGSSGENFILASTTEGTDGSQIASPHLLTQNLIQPGSLGQHPHSLGFTDQRGSQQGLARASLRSELSGSNHKKGGPGRIVIADRGSVGERGFVLPSKLKQVYVAKPAITSANVGAATADTISNIFSGQEVA